MFTLSRKATSYLNRLCQEIPSRRVGCQGNLAATNLFAEMAASHGFETESPEFSCLDWEAEPVRLTVDGEPFEASASPYSVGCKVSAPLVVVSTVEQLEAFDVSGKVLLLRGEIAREPLMPKNFPFYNPEEHQHILRLLETKVPAATVAAPLPNPGMIGAAYPYPLIEDGDFDIPSVYMAAAEGESLAARAGQVAVLASRARRIPARGRNVLARKGADQASRVTLCAHIDARLGSPGASDNAAGVVVLLLLAELLADYAGRMGVELVAMNGEDYYSNPGEQQYLAMNAGRFDEVLLGVNVDGVGYRRGRVAYSLYGCPPELAGPVREVFASREGFVEGEPWYQGDHSLFVMNQRPALALTSELAPELLAGVIHTPRDRPEILDPDRLAAVALALRELVLRLSQ